MSVTELRLAVQANGYRTHSMRGQAPHARRLAEQGRRHRGRDRALGRHQYRHARARPRRRSTSTSPTPRPPRSPRTSPRSCSDRASGRSASAQAPAAADHTVSHRDAVSEDVARVSRRPAAPCTSSRCLCAGQQFIIDGIHPDTGKPYTWHGASRRRTRHATSSPRSPRRTCRRCSSSCAERLEAELGWRRIYTNGHGPTSLRATTPARSTSTRASAAMQFGGAGGLHQTQLSVTASLLRDGVGFDETVNTVFEATKAAVAGDPRAAQWNWAKELNYIGRMCSDFIVKNPELLDCPAVADASRRSREALARGASPTLRLPQGSRLVVCVQARRRAQGAASRHRSRLRRQGPTTATRRPPYPDLGLYMFRPVDEASPAGTRVALWPALPAPHGEHDREPGRHRQDVAGDGRGGGHGHGQEPARRAAQRSACASGITTARITTTSSPGAWSLSASTMGSRRTSSPGSSPITSGNEFPLRVAKGYSDLKIDTPLIKHIGAQDRQAPGRRRHS